MNIDKLAKSMYRFLPVILLMAFLLPCAFLAWNSRDLPQLGNLHDDAVYWVTAESLGQGRGYHVPSLPGEPYQTKYPPLYPLWLSLAWRIQPAFPANLPLALWLTWLLLPVYLWLCNRFYRVLGIGPMPCLFLCAWLALNPFVALFSTSLMSELPFTVLLLATILMAELAGRADSPSRMALCTGLLAGAAYLTRTAGAPLLLSVPLGFLLRRQSGKALLFVAAMLPFAAGWTLWTSAHVGPTGDAELLYYTSYAGYHAHYFSAREIPHLVLYNLLELWNSFGAFLGLAIPGKWPGQVVTSVATGIGLAGAVRISLRTGALQYALFGATYLAALSVWDFPRGERFAFVLLPLFLAGIYDGLREVWSRLLHPLRGGTLLRKGVAIAGLAFLGLSGLFAAVGISNGYRTLYTLAAESREAIRCLPAAYAWIMQHTPIDAVILARRDPVVYLYTQRRSIYPVPSPRQFYWDEEPRWADYASLAALAKAHGASYLMVTPRDLRAGRLERFVDAETLHSPDFEPVYQSPSATIYRVNLDR